MNEINRREFLSKSGKAAFVAGGVAFGSTLLGRLPFVKTPAFGEESPGGFNVYNAINPNAKSIQSHTFKDSISQGLKPAICYNTSKPMVAVAKGRVVDVREVETLSTWWKNLGSDPGGAKGFWVEIRHGLNYRVFYQHLQQPELKFGQIVKRGQRIGSPAPQWNSPTLYLFEIDDPVDPDNYGMNHGFMDYWDGDTELEIGKEEQEKRVERQQQLLYKLAELYTGPEKYTLLAKKHKYRDKIFKWSLVEKFRYLGYLYQKDPKLFPSMTKEQFELVRKEFYENQPIILTLPLEKG
jgi:hypothetical protein